MRLREQYTFKEIVDSLSREKRAQDGTVTRFFHRPLSFPLAWFFFKTGFSPNGVTYLSILFCACGFICTLIPSISFHFIGIVFFTLFGTLDCVDGNMARTIRNRKSRNGLSQDSGKSFGEWVDALGGYCAYTAMILSLGLSSMLVSGGKATWMIAASVTCAANLLMRLAFQSYRVVSGDPSRAGIGSEKRFSEEIGITGWFQVLYYAGLAWGFLPWVLIGYSAVYCAGCLVTVTKLIIKVERSPR